jgi:predicted dehydrogenase
MKLLVVGAGLRGRLYTRRAVQAGAEVVAVAEPDDGRRARFAADFRVPAEHVYADWRALEHQPRLADAAIVATQDRLHADPAVLLAGQGYHLLLEKPMAPTEPEATRIADAVQRAGVLFAVCHVMRYTVYTAAVLELLHSGRIGRLVSIQHLEPVGWWHQAHSFVRGNWRDTQASSPMLLAKSCHDIDWLLYVAGQSVRRVSSFGGLAHFRPAEKPAGAGDRCLDCAVEPDCPYSAVRLYLNQPDLTDWPVSALTPVPTVEAVRAALRTGPYGECVYNGQNDVVDHQVVSLELTDGATVSFTMTAFTPFEQRKTRLFGTHGFVEGDGVRLRVVDFRTGSDETLEVVPGGSTTAGHGGGDDALVDAFVAAVESGDGRRLRSDAATSLESHRVVWAAERARLTGTVVELRDQ